jgi:hypothetical protein
MKTLRPLPPKEFSEVIGGLLSPKTVRKKCATGELQTVNGPRKPPYFIVPQEVARYRPVIERFLVPV